MLYINDAFGEFEKISHTIDRKVVLEQVDLFLKEITEACIRRLEIRKNDQRWARR